MFRCPRQASQDQLARGGAAHINGPYDHIGDHQPQAESDTRRDIRDSPCRASGHAFRTTRVSTHETRPLICQRILTDNLLRSPETVRFMSSLTEPPESHDAHLHPNTSIASALLCVRRSRSI